jgi:hypothetical protein
MGDTVREILAHSPHCTLKQLGWCSWPDFQRTIRTMHLLLQPSFTESFNMVSADGVAQGVPSVVSDAIDWCPDHWQAAADDTMDIANKGIALLHDPSAPADGLAALRKHNRHGILDWGDYLIPELEAGI